MLLSGPVPGLGTPNRLAKAAKSATVALNLKWIMISIKGHLVLKEAGTKKFIQIHPPGYTTTKGPTQPRRACNGPDTILEKCELTQSMAQMHNAKMQAALKLHKLP